MSANLQQRQFSRPACVPVAQSARGTVVPVVSLQAVNSVETTSATAVMYSYLYIAVVDNDESLLAASNRQFAALYAK
jgi:hypothetical protein